MKHYFLKIIFSSSLLIIGIPKGYHKIIDQYCQHHDCLTKYNSLLEKSLPCCSLRILSLLYRNTEPAFQYRSINVHFNALQSSFQSKNWFWNGLSCTTKKVWGADLANSPYLHPFKPLLDVLDKDVRSTLRFMGVKRIVWYSLCARYHSASSAVKWSLCTDDWPTHYQTDCHCSDW